MAGNDLPTYHDALLSEAYRKVSYTNLGFDSSHDVIIPPSAPSLNLDVVNPQSATSPNYMNIPEMVVPDFVALTNKEIRQACYHYIEDSCCYGSRAVKDMIFSSIYNTFSLHYKLESFGEMRQTALKSVPYKGEYIDGMENGPSLQPWNIPVPNSNMFQDMRSYIEVPHSAYVQPCIMCSGTGRVSCSSCSGSGSTNCMSCFGSGRDSDGGRCSSCFGSGKTSCSSCSGFGNESCSTCEGYGKQKHYKELIVTWKNHVDDYVANSMNLPSDLLKKASGKRILLEENPVVSPIFPCPDAQVTEMSCVFINKHKQSYANELIHMQRQTLRAIPVTRVSYSWRRKEGEFYVYSFENEVYFENYPQKCCCCICC